MNTFMDYMIEAEESAVSNYLDDIEFEMNMYAFEATEVADAPTTSIKPKRTLWDIIKAIFAKIAKFFKWIFGKTDELEKAAEKKKDEPQQALPDTLPGNSSHHLLPDNLSANGKKAKIRSIQPQQQEEEKSTNVKPRSIQSSSNTEEAPKSAAQRKPLIDKLNKARSVYAKATENAVNIIFDTANASCALLSKIKAGWGVPKGKKFDNEIVRINEMFGNCQMKYHDVTEARNEYEEAKNAISSFGNVSRFLTYMNIDYIKPICDKIKTAAKTHFQYCDDFCKSIDNAKNKYNEDVSKSDDNTYKAAKQYLDIAKLANKATADFRRCAADVFN